MEDRVVDGARSKWCVLLILDAVIYLLNHHGFDLARRRTFNQHRVLFESIWDSIVESVQTSVQSDPGAGQNNLFGVDAALKPDRLSGFEQILRIRQSCSDIYAANGDHKGNDFHASHAVNEVSSSFSSSGSPQNTMEIQKFWQSLSSKDSERFQQCYRTLSSCLCLQDAWHLPAPWHDIQDLQQTISQTEPASKSSPKWNRILNALCQHSSWQNRQKDSSFIASVYQQVIYNAILFFHNYVSDLSLRLSMSVATDPLNSSLASITRLVPTAGGESSIQIPSLWFVSALGPEERRYFSQSIWPCVLSARNYPLLTMSSTKRTLKRESMARKLHSTPELDRVGSQFIRDKDDDVCYSRNAFDPVVTGSSSAYVDTVDSISHTEGSVRSASLLTDDSAAALSTKSSVKCFHSIAKEGVSSSTMIDASSSSNENFRSDRKRALSRVHSTLVCGPNVATHHDSAAKRIKLSHPHMERGQSLKFSATSAFTPLRSNSTISTAMDTYMGPSTSPGSN